MMTFYEANKEEKRKNLQRSTVTKNKQNGSKEKKIKSALNATTWIT